MPEFVLDITQDQYEKAGSKWITFSPTDPAGKLYFKPVELDMPDWDNVGVSLKFPVRITGDDADAGKEDKLSCGVDAKGVWKLKEIYKNITGKDLTMRKGADGKKHPVFNSDDVAGKQAVGCWEIQVGSKGGDPSKGQTKYPKLVNIYPADFVPEVKQLV